VTELILASGSAVRAQLLRSACVAFAVVPARVDEDAVKEALLARNVPMRGIADALAELKAVRVSNSHPGKLVLGADQVLVFENELVSKSANVSEARALLSKLRGRTHELVGAAVLAKDGAPVWRHVGSATLAMRDFSDSFLEDYLAREGEAVLDSVGCYQLERRGAQLFANIAGDYFSILGLPLLPVLAALRDQSVVAS
jgi:septum formation protein